MFLIYNVFNLGGKICSLFGQLQQQGNQARFDFNGCLVSKADNIPEYLGLHHHGDDPSSPGYTLEELFILARSSFLQQRIFVLQVLARIIRQVLCCFFSINYVQKKTGISG